MAAIYPLNSCGKEHLVFHRTTDSLFTSPYIFLLICTIEFPFYNLKVTL